MTFTHLPAMARFIARNHSLFGLCPASMALDVLGQINAAITANKAVMAVTVPALVRYEDGDCNGYLETYCTIGRDNRGAWYIKESTNCPV